MSSKSPSLLHQGERQRKPEHRRVDHTAPIPLGHVAACEKAVQLRETNPIAFTWATIAEVMRIYHGFDRCAAWWRVELRGRVTSRARGNAFTKEAA
jgi:hypothetical protein